MGLTYQESVQQTSGVISDRKTWHKNKSKTPCRLWQLSPAMRVSTRYRNSTTGTSSHRICPTFVGLGGNFLFFLPPPNPPPPPTKKSLSLTKLFCVCKINVQKPVVTSVNCISLHELFCSILKPLFPYYIHFLFDLIDNSFLFFLVSLISSLHWHRCELGKKKREKKRRVKTTQQKKEQRKQLLFISDQYYWGNCEIDGISFLGRQVIHNHLNFDVFMNYVR